MIEGFGSFILGGYLGDIPAALGGAGGFAGALAGFFENYIDTGVYFLDCQQCQDNLNTLFEEAFLYEQRKGEES